MTPQELVDELIQLASEAGLRVRSIRGAPQGDGEPPAASGVCRVGQSLWVVLSQSDSPEHRADVLCAALAAHAGDFLESRYVAPLLRAQLAPYLERSESEVGDPAAAPAPRGVDSG